MTERSDTAPAAARLTIRSTKRFNILIVYLYGLLLMIPVLLAMAATSLLSVGLAPALLPLAVTLATALFLPTGFGNPYILRLVRSLTRNPGREPDSFVVQLTLHPRAREGLRGLMEDADDFGLLRLTPVSLDYRGDAMDLTLPLEQVTGVIRQNIGLRGLFLYERVRVTISGMPDVQHVDFAERSAWMTTGSRRVTRELHKQILGRLKTSAPARISANQPAEVRGAAGK